jgi:ComF family protein
VSFLAPGLRSLARGALFEIADAVFPPLCPLCRRSAPPDGLGCSDHRLPLAPEGPRCGRCAAALPPSIADGERCSGCRSDPPSFTRTIALADYREQPSIREWILALKHGRRRDLAPILGRALGARLLGSAKLAAEDREGAPRLVPVPLHPWRRLYRSYDQALLVAEEVGRTAGLEVVRALARVRATAVQGSVGAPSRTANVAAAFAVRRGVPVPARAISGCDVWIVDDVVTSGATASECARVLRRLGARTVGVLALARA